MARPNIASLIRNSELFTKAPLLELAGDNRILVENHQGVLAYSLEEVHIKVAYGKLTIIGNNLNIKQMSKEQLVISGLVDEIRLFRR